MKRPLGATDGSPSLCSPLVSCSGVPPSAETRNRLLRPFSPVSDEKTRALPSGVQVGARSSKSFPVTWRVAASQAAGPSSTQARSST